MNNKIETFERFNQKMKRPDRKRHLELCGFKLLYASYADDCTPRDIAISRAKAFNEKHGKPAHVVYLQNRRNYDGRRHYDFWIKALEDVQA